LTHGSAAVSSTAKCAISQPLFFELRQVLNPRSLAGHSGTGTLERKLEVRVGQRLFQGFDPPLHFVPFADFIWLFHADDLSELSVAVLAGPLLDRVTTSYAVLAPDSIKGNFSSLQLRNYGHFKRLTVPYSRLSDSVYLSHG